MFFLRYITYLISIFLMTGIMTACEDLVEVDPRKPQISKDIVFSNDATAASAITSIYANMYSNTSSFASGSNYSVTAVAGISSDELRYFAESIELSSIANYQTLATNQVVLGLWKSMYQAIYASNNAIQGLEYSSSLTPLVKERLLGEAYFIRGFCYFYLVNLFGGVPMITSTDYTENAKATRRDVPEIYERIKGDLSEAYSKLSDDYPSDGRVRANKSAAAAMLARVSLFLGEWVEAAENASIVLGNPNYGLETLDRVFLADSKEAVLQLMPEGLYQNTNEGSLFVLQYAPITDSQPFALSDELLQDFEIDDQRASIWVGMIESEGSTYFYPNKYKVFFGGTLTEPKVELTEYSMVIRLAELFLIRAEARVKAGDLDGAVSDLDTIRTRAGLMQVKDAGFSTDAENLLLLIEHERRIELFAEWGHRWLDLKRTGRADVILSGRDNWSPNFKLYPIPQQERLRNPFLGEQNLGY